MNELAAKARAGELTAEEERELDDYRGAGHLLETLKSQARRRLREITKRGALIAEGVFPP